jgi:hypothetical protein
MYLAWPEAFLASNRTQWGIALACIPSPRGRSLQSQPANSRAAPNELVWTERHDEVAFDLSSSNWLRAPNG